MSGEQLSGRVSKLGGWDVDPGGVELETRSSNFIKETELISSILLNIT